MGKRGPMTDEAKAARLAKRRATLEAKKQAALKQLGEPPTRKKLRKGRKMTAEQKAAAVERLAKAREAKKLKTADSDAPAPKYHAVDPTVVALPDDNPMSLKNVREWLKQNKMLLKSISDMKTSKSMKDRLEYIRVSCFVQDLETYIRTGVYLNSHSGKDGKTPVKRYCVAMAYYADGTPKRTVGVHYPDIGLYTTEMEKEDRAAA